MYEQQVATRFGLAQQELNNALYQRYSLERQLLKLDEDIPRMEARLVELGGLRQDVEAHKAIEEAQAKADAEDAKKKRKKKPNKK